MLKIHKEQLEQLEEELEILNLNLEDHNYWMFKSFEEVALHLKKIINKQEELFRFKLKLLEEEIKRKKTDDTNLLSGHFR